MHLKRLKLRNFKSFAGATEIPFEPGFTGVAGPNGMGKSNISDAILFVLGPTSSKVLRAERLPHLFFNGGSSKKPATECEVSLVFDNSDRLLPVESDEVELTRYVKLAPNDPDGYYSYFYVNGKRTTQGEIDAILSHARLSGDGYNLIQQGDVNKIVGMGPVPRRELVERLAGISQFDDELGRAETKRNDLDANLERIRTILGEVKSHLSSLESQRLQAIQYRQLEEDQGRAEARLARADHRMAGQEVESCQGQVVALEAQIAQFTEDHARLSEERDALARKLSSLEEEIAKAGGEEARKLREEVNEKTLGHARLLTDLEHQNEAIEAVEARIAEIGAQTEGDQHELGRFRTDEGKHATELAAISKKAEEAAAAISEITAGAEHSQKRLAGVRKHELELERTQERQQKAWQEAIRSREGASATLEGSERTKAQAEDDQREREVEVRDLELRLKEAGGAAGGKKASSGDLQKELFQLRNKEKELASEIERLSREVVELNRRYLAIDARIKVREESRGRPGSQSAVEFILSQRNLGKIAGIRGTVEELAQYDAKHQMAIEVAGGGRFHALVVETDAIAEECIRLLRAENRGRATFLPLNKILPSRPRGKSLISAQSPGALGFAIDLVQFDEALRPAFWYVFGETVVMDDLEHARAQMGGVRLVTLSGDLIEATGAMTGGSFEKARNGRTGESPADLKRMGLELQEKSAAESAGRADLDRLGLRIREISEELAKRSIQADANQSTRKLLDQEMVQARQRLQEAADRIRSAGAEHSQGAATLAEAEALASRLAAELESLKVQLSRSREEFLSQLPNQTSQRLRELQEAAQAATEERVRVHGELEGLRASIAALSQRLQEAVRRDGEAQSDLKAKRAEAGKIAKRISQAKAALDGIKSVEGKLGSAAVALSAEKRELDAQQLDLVGRLATAATTLETRRSLLGQEESRLAIAQAHLREVETALAEFPEPEADEKPVPVDELKRIIATVRGQLEAMGSVNLRALEEFDEEKARLDQFTSEVGHLSEEKTGLISLVGEIEEKKRTRIAEVVGQVSVFFHEVYQELSDGGEGEILLENPKDPLAGGLLIRARPVGKTIQRLEQLSGGEKSLASLAFIFALQRYDPSPLYVFDEVDMSLDGQNAEYVGRMLRRNSERAQFIVISLRKVTLKFASHLFGVTMRGDGCSRVVGLHLDEIRDVEERERARSHEAAPLVAP